MEKKCHFVQLIVMAGISLICSLSWALTCGPGQDGKVRLIGNGGKELSPALPNIQDCEALLRMIQSHSKSAQIETSLQQANPDLTKLTPMGNASPDTQTGFNYWRQCEDPQHKKHLTKNKDGFITEECAPDTLFSWGNFVKVNTMALLLRDGGDWPEKLSSRLFTSLSAAGTFGYGPIPMRFKIKPGVKFRFLDSPATSECSDMAKNGNGTEQDFRTTIFARYASMWYGMSLFEYIICSPQVFESWSYATPEHYDEILRDYSWMTTQSGSEWEAYIKFGGSDKFLNAPVDRWVMGTDFSLSYLIKSMNFLRTLTQNGFGEILTPRGGRANKQTHFETKRPIYFNPN